MAANTVDQQNWTKEQMALKAKDNNHTFEPQNGPGRTVIDFEIFRSTYWAKIRDSKDEELQEIIGQAQKIWDTKDPAKDYKTLPEQFELEKKSLKPELEELQKAEKTLTETVAKLKAQKDEAKENAELKAKIEETKTKLVKTSIKLQDVQARIDELTLWAQYNPNGAGEFDEDEEYPQVLVCRFKKVQGPPVRELWKEIIEPLTIKCANIVQGLPKWARQIDDCFGIVEAFAQKKKINDDEDDNKEEEVEDDYENLLKEDKTLFSAIAVQN